MVCCLFWPCCEADIGEGITNFRKSLDSSEIDQGDFITSGTNNQIHVNYKIMKIAYTQSQQLNLGNFVHVLPVLRDHGYSRPPPPPGGGVGGGGGGTLGESWQLGDRPHFTGGLRSIVFTGSLYLCL